MYTRHLYAGGTEGGGQSEKEERWKVQVCLKRVLVFLYIFFFVFTSPVSSLAGEARCLAQILFLILFYLFTIFFLSSPRLQLGGEARRLAHTRAPLTPTTSVFFCFIWHSFGIATTHHICVIFYYYHYFGTANTHTSVCARARE